MTKIRIRTGRGTGSKEIDTKDNEWVGDKFRKLQSAKKEKSKNKIVSSGRGTSSRKYEDIPDPVERPSTEGMTRVTGRGTSSRKNENKETD